MRGYARSIVCCVLVTVLLSGCGSDDKRKAAPTATPQSTAVPTATATATPPPVPRAVARRITDPTDLITGPLAHGRIGDYLLANDVARFIIQDVAKRDIWSVGAFGGNIIDAELIGHPGLDNFLEIQPAINVETVINAQTAEIINDGADGNPAIIRTCGPDDLLDFVNPSTILEAAGVEFPDSADDQDSNVDACTEYSIELGKPYVKMVTTVTNNDDVEVGLFVGDFVNASGEVEAWANSGDGIGDFLTASMGVLDWIGYGQATGVDYFHITIPFEGSPFRRSSFFTAAGVSYILHSHSVLAFVAGQAPTFVVPAHGSREYVRYFGVGDGSGGNAIDVETALKGTAAGTLGGCVTVGGEPAAAVRVSVGPVLDGVITGVTSTWVTDAAGCFEGAVPIGAYGVAAAQRGTPYEGGGTYPFIHPVTIVEDQATHVDIPLPATGRLHVQVTDENGAPVPARISVVGIDPSPEPEFMVPGESGMTVTGLFNDIGRDREPFGCTRIEYADASGEVELNVEPGNYQLFVSRGTEYSLFESPVTLTGGETTTVEARIAHVVDSSGFVSSDFHVHGINSADARVSHYDRARQFAGEGVDNIIMTDHHSHTDLNPTIDGLGLTPFVHATVGEEITTWDYGHYNAYPLLIDPTRPSGGSTDWGGAAEPGRDFTAYGSYTLPLNEIAELAMHGPTSTPDTVIQINHINSTFDPLRIDTSMVPPQTFITPEERIRFRLDPNGGNLFYHFPALEVWNGSGRGSQADMMRDRIGIWFNHLNQGLITTGIADTDTHEFTNLNTAGARTWTATAAPTDEAATIDGGEVARSVRAGRAVGGQGVYVQTRLLARDGSGAVADLTAGGSTTVASSNRSVDLEIDVQSPLWAEYDRIEIYANAATIPTTIREGIPVLFGAEPTRVLIAGTDFEVETDDLFPEIPGALRHTTAVTVPFADLTSDTWFVVVVRGTDGISHPMFPVMVHDIDGANQTLEQLIDGNLGEGGVLAHGFTNALYADVDGEPGFHAPLAR